MILPDQPATVPAPSPVEEPWWWRLEDKSGAVVVVTGDLADQHFVSQADAESWVGEIWASLAEVGVDAVSLFEREREVYGPMSLHAS